MNGWPVFLGMVLLIGGLAWVSWYLAEKRRKMLMAWAQAHALTFNADHEYGFDGRYPDFSALQKGENRYAYNTMRGNWNKRQLLAFDYHYETHSTDSKGRRRTHHHHFSAAILTSEVRLKPLFIRPEGLFDKITEFFGYDDIDFESAEFSRKFYVKAQDKKWAYDVIHQRTMEFLLAQPTFTLQFEPRCVMACRGSCFGHEDFAKAIEVMEGILERLPEYVVQQQREA